MSGLTRDAVLSRLNGGADALANGAFRGYFEKATGFEAIVFDSFEDFSKIIWHFSPFSRVLTPPTWWGGGKLYTVGQVAEYMISKGITFPDLASGKIDGVYQPSWFESCEILYNNFDWERCQPLMLLAARWSERLYCPTSRYRLIDGIHRSLVIAYKVRLNELKYRPVNGIVMR